MKYTKPANSFEMNNNLLLLSMVLVLFAFMLTVGAVAYPYHLANAKSSKPLTGSFHITSTHDTNCNGDVCVSNICVNNRCHSSAANQTQGLNSTIP
jgi:predicted neutral ceramidase superfamily lipid hydrolase